MNLVPINSTINQADSRSSNLNGNDDKEKINNTKRDASVDADYNGPFETYLHPPLRPTQGVICQGAKGVSSL